MTDDDKYSLLNRNNLTQPIQILLSQKQKTFYEFFWAFLKSTLNFDHFQQKDDPYSRRISQITVSKKEWLDKCLEYHASEYPSTNNMINGHKHSCNSDDATFTIFVDPCENSSVGKSLY